MVAFIHAEQALLELAQDVKTLKSRHAALAINMSGIPSISNRVVFRAFVSFIRDRCHDRALAVHPVARNVVIVTLPESILEPVMEQLGRLDRLLVGRRHGTLKLKLFHLATEYDAFVTYCTRQVEVAPPPSADRSVAIHDPAPPDMKMLDRLIDIERTIGQADLSMQIRSQSIWRLHADDVPLDWAEELWVSVHAIEQIAGQDLAGQPWLFDRITELFDSRVLAHLARETRLPLRRRFINLTPSGIAGGALRHLLAMVTAEQGHMITAEMSLTNWRMDPAAAGRLVTMLHRQGQTLALDGVRPDILRDLASTEIQQADYIKIDAAARPVADLHGLLEDLPADLAPKTILCRCDDTAHIAAGLKHGIGLFQGRGLTRFLSSPDQVEPLLGRNAANGAAAALKRVNRA